jgi:hypothetical protein
LIEPRAPTDGSQRQIEQRRKRRRQAESVASRPLTWL